MILIALLVYKNSNKTGTKANMVPSAETVISENSGSSSAKPPPLQFAENDDSFISMHAPLESGVVTQRQQINPNRVNALPPPIQLSDQVIQRESGHGESDFDNEEIARPVSVTLSLGAPTTYQKVVQIANYEQLANAFDEFGSVLFFSESSLFPDQDRRLNPFYNHYKDFYDIAADFYNFYTKKIDKSQAPLNIEIQELRNQLSRARSIGQRGYQNYKQRLASLKADIESARNRVNDARREALKGIRALFLSGNKIDGSQSSDHTFLWAMADNLATLGGSLSNALQLPFERLATVIPSVVSVANVAINWSSVSPALKGTALEGLPALNNTVSVIGALNSTFINPGLIVTSYIGPMLAAITAMLSKIHYSMIEGNDTFSDFSGYPANFSVEPGGKEMWNFMVRVMQAGSTSEIPGVSTQVMKYFDDFRTRFDQLNKAKYQGDLKNHKENSTEFSYPSKPKEIPTESSYLVFSKLDAKKFRGWIFNNRQLVWTSLYGSRNPNTAKIAH